MNITESPFTRMAFELNNFKFAVKIPKFKLRKPRILTKKRHISDDSDSSERSRIPSFTLPRVASCTPRFPKYNSDTSSTVSTDPSFTSDDWIREFNARCKTVPKIQKPAEVEDVEKNFYSNVPSATSTPVSCKIVPLNRINTEEEERKTRFLPNVSGIKIYETVDMGSDGNEIDTSSSDESRDDNSDYETIQFKNQKIVPTPKTLFRPTIRTLKYSRR